MIFLKRRTVTARLRIGEENQRGLEGPSARPRIASSPKPPITTSQLAFIQSGNSGLDLLRPHHIILPPFQTINLLRGCCPKFRLARFLGGRSFRACLATPNRGGRVAPPFRVASLVSITWLPVGTRENNQNREAEQTLQLRRYHLQEKQALAPKAAASLWSSAAIWRSVKLGHYHRQRKIACRRFKSHGYSQGIATPVAVDIS